LTVFLHLGERDLSQLMGNFAMEIKINIRKWTRDDLPQIHKAWLDYCRTVARSDMRIRSDADGALLLWLTSRFRQAASLGFVAEVEGRVVGFLTARIDDWESMPPVIEPRRIGIIDAVYVADEFRRQGIGSQLIDRAILAMRTANAVAVETIYDAWNDASTHAWHRAGFAPWMVHAYRML
jgi:GNAT superfamily N-acetyltransferase